MNQTQREYLESLMDKDLELLDKMLRRRENEEKGEKKLIDPDRGKRSCLDCLMVGFEQLKDDPYILGYKCTSKIECREMNRWGRKGYNMEVEDRYEEEEVN